MNSSENSTPLPDSKVVLSPEVITGELKLQLTKLGYQYETILQNAANIKFSKDSIQQDYAPLKRLRELSTEISNLENPHTKAWSDWNKKRKSLLDPVNAELATKTAEYKKLADAIKKELDEQEAETARIKTITDAKAAFIIDFAGKTAAATTIDELVSLQMRIGTEKSRKNFWQEYLPEFIEACKGLENGLKTQKEKLRKLQGLEEKEKTATDEQLLAILDEKEILTAELEQGKTDVQETVMKTATNPTIERTVGLSTFVAPKPRRTSWKYKITDEKKAFAAGMLTTEINAVKAKFMMAELRQTDKEATEFFKDGIMYYAETNY